MSIKTQDTICAISTPLGENGIGIVRLSGPKAIKIVNGIFLFSNKKSLAKMSTFTLHYGHIINSNPKSEIRNPKLKVIDEVLVTVMRAPKTYTREDVVEINCHGGIVPLRRVLKLCLENGVRLAQPGEFTMRAFLNGRLDLVQAEAVCDIIRAKTEQAMNCAVMQLEGNLSKKIKEIKNEIINILSLVEASIDFSEEDIEFIQKKEIKRKIKDIIRKIGKLLEDAESGKILRDGLKIAIIGKPNVGKSSLLNLLLREERAIVTPIPGTTRDVIEDMINIKGIPAIIMDTAGIKSHSQSFIEKIGVEKSKKSLKAADLILFVVDASIPLSKEDRNISQTIKNCNKKVIIIANKSDLRPAFSIKTVNCKLSTVNSPIVWTSCVKKTGINELENKIYTLFIHGKVEKSNAPFVTNIRHKNALDKTENSLKRAIQVIENGKSEEFIALDLREALNSLAEIIGETITDDILSQIFSKFCIGK